MILDFSNLLKAFLYDNLGEPLKLYSGVSMTTTFLVIINQRVHPVFVTLNHGG